MAPLLIWKGSVYMIFKKWAVLLLVIGVYFAGFFTYYFMEVATNDGFNDYRVFFRDENGKDWTHIAPTNEGDLWIYDAMDRKVLFIENPKQSNQLKVIEKELNK